MPRWHAYLVVAWFASAAACSSVSTGVGSVAPDAGPVSDGGPGQDGGPISVDGGISAGDAGAPGSDAGTIDGGGGGTDAGTVGGGGGTDAGTVGGSDGGAIDGGATSDCDGLLPGTPGAPKQFTLTQQDRHDGDCIAGESDGTGHVVATWVATSNTEGRTNHFFVDPGSAAVVGTYPAANMHPIGQLDGFMGTECVDGNCYTAYIVLSPIGEERYRSPNEGPSTGTANDPTGGLVHILETSKSDGFWYRVEAVDATGRIRWNVPLAGSPNPRQLSARIAVDREGSVLVITSPAFGQRWNAQWISHDGVPGPQFQPFSTDQFPGNLFERVGNGLFLTGTNAGQSAWIGQFEPMSTTMTPPPGWLASRKPSNLHMVHGGRGYAFFPFFFPSQTSAACEQTIDVVSPSGQSCGSATFKIDDASCTPSSIVVGYDGTVVQQLPFEREASSCRAADHECDCTYRFWPGFFR